MLDNTIANMNRGWESRESMFRCEIPGLYFFSMAGRGRWSYGSDVTNNNDVVDDATVVEENRRIRMYNLRSRDADREACLDWK
jgi:hypothetical protein